MTSENEDHSTRYDERKFDIMLGIYRLVRGIEAKTESILDELREAIDARSEDYSRYGFLDNGNYENGAY